MIGFDFPPQILPRAFVDETSSRRVWRTGGMTIRNRRYSNFGNLRYGVGGRVRGLARCSLPKFVPQLAARKGFGEIFVAGSDDFFLEAGLLDFRLERFFISGAVQRQFHCLAGPARV